MVKITGEYTGQLHCAARHGPSGSVLATDAPRDNQGKGESFSPTDLVATGYATCVVTTLAIAARRQGVELGPLRFEVTKEMSTEGPRRIARLGLRIWLPAEARKLPEDFVRKTAENCPVHLTLAPDVQKVIDFEWL